jgi:hypothetical protein
VPTTDLTWPHCLPFHLTPLAALSTRYLVSAFLLNRIRATHFTIIRQALLSIKLKFNHLHLIRQTLNSFSKSNNYIHDWKWFIQFKLTRDTNKKYCGTYDLLLFGRSIQGSIMYWAENPGIWTDVRGLLCLVQIKPIQDPHLYLPLPFINFKIVYSWDCFVQGNMHGHIFSAFKKWFHQAGRQIHGSITSIIQREYEVMSS